MKKGVILGKPYDIVDSTQFYDNREIYKDATVAVSFPTESEDKNITLPYLARGTRMDKPGIYDAGVIDIIQYPVGEQQMEEYSPQIIDFDNITSMEEYKTKTSELGNIEKQYLTTVSGDNCFIPPLLETDTPEMRAVKEAIISKNIDLDKYAERYGTNYPNDKRRYKDDKITLFLIKRTCECLDMKASLILEDKNPDVPNPIGRKITANLTSGFNEDEE